MKLKDLEKLANEATPGPWVATVAPGGWDAVAEDRHWSSLICLMSLNHSPNAAFIAAHNPARMQRIYALLKQYVPVEHLEDL